MDNHAGGYRRQIGAHPALVFEPRAEFRSFQVCQDPWRDAAGDEYAAARPIRERDRSEERRVGKECRSRRSAYQSKKKKSMRLRPDKFRDHTLWTVQIPS